ncbi:DUF839 domain-containing protein [Neolewinella aurantiaca]|uniref:DUF839 domain-containing protein n=1 Tax=Neolewinella aurantiaca TaxID=2602767 RepID=A0A5C7FAX1_9BACT|nr:alkaline phosphatase PhoX [Neolewinella aurantiaca]TXF87791.1 DUF839 domain-containing protein [Neolewinella aurantiaca]
MRSTFSNYLLLLLCCLCGALNAQVVTTSVRITSSSDDAEERGLNSSSPGVIDLTSTDLELVNDGSDGDQFVGMRFNGLQVPQNARIINAYVQFTVDETVNADGTVFIQAEDTDNALAYQEVLGNISGRALLSDTITWSDIPDWTAAGDAGDDQRTPDISALVQAIVDRDGWAAGNALGLVMTGTGERTAEAFDGASDSAPMLVVEYVEMVTATFTLGDSSDDVETNVSSGANDITSSDLEITTENAPQVISLRFPGVTIPSGSEITSSYIQFAVDESSIGGDVDAMILFDQSGNAAPLTATYDPTSPDFDLPVFWNNIPDWSTVGEAGPDQRSADLSSSLEQVFSLGNWRSGNALLIGMVDPVVLSIPGYTGNTGKRVAESYDGDTDASPKLVVSYFPPVTFEDGGFPVAAGSSWKFLDQGIALDTVDWTSLDYDDAAWSFGDAILGYGGNGEITTLGYGSDEQNKHVTTYFRHTFEVENASQYDSLLFDVLRDDGVIVYLNGTEVFRQNMPAGDVVFGDLASGTVGSDDENTYYREKIANLLTNDRNVIAVELHQATASSSDLSFDLALGFTFPPLSPASFPLTRGTEWHYLDNGTSLDDQDWKDTGYAITDDSWLAGQGPLGYGGDVATELSFGTDPENKFVTTYFRREIDIDLTTLPDSVQLSLRRDDGAIVYLNGVEVARSNMPDGDVDYLTTAATRVEGSDETNYFGVNLYPEQFRDGVNTIAVEVHQFSLNSSDLVFDLELDAAPVVNPPALGCEDGNEGHIACFTSITPTAETPNLILPAGSHRFQAIHKQGGTYSIGGGTIPGLHDFTGFVPLNNTSSTAGYLSINHETSPGGVSMLGLHYDADTNLWVVDSSQAVDLYNDDLVTTVRNCSGGITPWGTVITAEESRNNTDANNDGYTDVGWLIEIDPVTAKVVEYGNGKQEKLWAAGRISHENAVVLNDERTLFTGEDGGSSAVFKFVADNPRDLSSGKLYALQLSEPLVGGEPTGTAGTWIEIPNTTEEDRNNTRALAVAMGATNFNGVEDLEFSPLTGQIYFTSKGHGRVYRFTDGDAGVTDFETFVGGASYVLNTENGVFTEPWRTGNDNLTFDDQGNLWVLQDGGLNYIWLVRPGHTQEAPMVELFASAPVGAELTGLTFTPDYKYGFFSVQHPAGTNQPQLDATGNEVTFNASTTIIFSRSEYLGEQPPVIAFEADRRVVVQGESVSFSDVSENGVEERRWVFDGGVPAVSDAEQVDVTYNGLGFYTVSLEVANAQGEVSVVEEAYIEVIEPAPVTDFTANNVMVATNADVTFFDLSTNNPTSWDWIFEGGSPATSNVEMPTVTYTEPGTYAVSLVTGNRAGSGTTEAKTSYIEVMRPVSSNDPVGQGTNLAVFPNPTAGKINIRMEETAGKKITFQLFDLTGRLLADIGVVDGIAGTGIWSYDTADLAVQGQVVVLKVTLDGEATHRMIRLTK